MKLKTLLGYAAIAFILFFAILEPTSAAHVVTNIGNFLTSVASGFTNFWRSL